MCGNPKGADPWADLAAQYGTLITVRANVPCPDRPGYKWPKDIEAIQARISAALLAVKTERQGQLQTTDVSLFGYSQGAHRAERLAAAYPHLYRTVALGGPPTSPTPERLRHARHIAILGGELENTTHMMDGYLDLVSSGLDAKFYLLPRAGHGSYGPEGRRVVAKVFGDLFRQAPREATWPPHHSLAPDDSASADGSR
jgi:pimeloyl-ACP methyl ester carboxylesterase